MALGHKCKQSVRSDTLSMTGQFSTLSADTFRLFDYFFKIYHYENKQ